MSNKPENVVHHVHLWPSVKDRDKDENRIDVCELSDGSVVIWYVEENFVVPIPGDMAQGIAMSKYYITSHHKVTEDAIINSGIPGEKDRAHEERLRFNKAKLMVKKVEDVVQILADFMYLRKASFADVADELDMREDDLWDIIECRVPAPNAATRCEWKARLGFF